MRRTRVQVRLERNVVHHENALRLRLSGRVERSIERCRDQ
jgi:hypothetical protein